MLPINGELLPEVSPSSGFLHPGIDCAPACHNELLAGRRRDHAGGSCHAQGFHRFPLAGPRLAYQEQDYSATITDGSGTPAMRHDLERCLRLFGGPEIGFRSVMPFGNGGDFHLIGRAAALWYGALDAHQLLDATDLDLDLTVATAVRPSVRVWSWRRGSGSDPNSRMLLTLDGNVVWWSAVPQVVNPSSGPGIDANDHAFSPATSAAATFTASLTAGLKIPLP